MTKKLEQLLGLAPMESFGTPEASAQEAKTFIDNNQAIIAEVDLAIDKIDLALPLVHELDTADIELDELATLAKEKFEDMISLGMNVEPRFSGVILQTAGMLLGHAITAKTAKIDKKLRMVQLQLQKAKLDYQIKKDAGGGKPEAPIDGEGMVVDRNEMLKSILAQAHAK